MARRTGRFRQTWTAIRAMIVLTIAVGLIYPAVVWGVGQLVAPAQANGSLVKHDGKVVGSSLIGQSFTDSKGNALPGWFQSRPSAAGNGYDATASSGSNLGPNSDVLVKAIKGRQAAIEKAFGADRSQIPADAVTTSASGLDPDISEAYALLQVDAVAAARHLSVSTVRALVESHVQPRELGYLGEPVVNVLELNLAVVHASD